MLGSSAQIVVRKAKPSDAKALAAVFGDSWRLAYRGIIPHLHLEGMIRRRGPDWWASAMRSGEGLLVLEVARAIAGYATFGRSRHRGGVTKAQGEIYEIYLAPHYQGLGLGERLFESCRHALDLRGLDGVLVWALADNTAAIEFYWHRGGRPVAEATERIGGARLAKIAFVWN
jgi:ribosomal protein S18 acetylase RimI-like enzyme